MNKDIPSYELCKKLKELGYNLRSFFYWLDFQGSDWLELLTISEKRDIPIKDEYICRAPTIWEMMDVLPATIDHVYGLVLFNKRFVSYSHNSQDPVKEYLKTFDYKDQSLPNALAKMLIRCLENNHLSLNE